MNDWQDLAEVDGLNLAGAGLYVMLPPTMYEAVTWALGVLLVVSLIALNVVKMMTYLNKSRKAKPNDDEPA